MKLTEIFLRLLYQPVLTLSFNTPSYEPTPLFTVMPVMDGPDATQAIRNLGVTCPIIGVTGNTLDTDIQRFIASGATDVYFKPFDMDKFTADMKELVK